MKQIMLTMVGMLLCATSAWALPPIPKYLPDILKGDEDSKAFAEAFSKMDGKCSVCHIPKADKKAKGHGLNDFGKAVHKHLDDKAFMGADKEKKADLAGKLLKEGWTKALSEKNEAGETFGSLVKEGKSPGKNP